ncbi:MAG: nitroreductase family protein [Neptunomonas phycophila]|uniref:nitroreductase family protein n=1 Tax=Neptunomonas phycophila TaxID=1572645 RepID=UPI003B8B5AAD
MQTFEAITSRRAVKQFDPEHVLTADEERELLSLAVLSPTAFNIQNWRFVVAKDKALREQIRAAAWDQAQVTDSSLLVIMCADLKAWEKEPERYWANTDQGTRDILLPAIDNYYRGKEQTQRDEAMRSCGMAAQTLMLTAKSMGYDSCPMDGFDFDAVGKLIKLPEDHVISMFVAIGKATKEAHPRGGQLPLTDVVITDTF